MSQPFERARVVRVDALHGVAYALLPCLLLLAAAQPSRAQALDPDAVRAEAFKPKGAAAAAARVASATWPSAANPFLSFLPVGEKPDYAAWQAWLREQSAAKRRTDPAPRPTSLIAASESEPNDTRAEAAPIPGLGSGVGKDGAADLTGVISPPPAPTIVGPFAEDDGSIPLAAAVGVSSGKTVRVSGTIGDGPHGGGGSAKGDYDFFALGVLAAGDEILVDVDTGEPFCCLDSWVTVWDEAGNLVAFNDDDPRGGTFDSYLLYTVLAAGTYYVSIGAYQSPFPSDPFDSSTGNGVATEGTYEVTLGVNAIDRDHFLLELERGDVVAANLLGATGTRISLIDPDGAERVGTVFNLNFISPGPVPNGGTAGFAYVVETGGTYAVRVGGVEGAYTLELRVLRPAFERALTGTVQKLFIDFDGATLDRSIFGVPGGRVKLSPLASFLPSFGLTPADEDALIDVILATIEENLSSDMRVLSANGDYDASQIPGEFDVVLLNSRDHADPFGEPYVSRVIVGGTMAELGIFTIGIAQSIDPGNFAGEETGVVLLDLLSGPSFDPNSLNQFPLGPGASKIELVGRGIGNVAAHEAGHLFANFHTDQFNDVPNIMDQGGNLAGLVGVGPDFVFGTEDDVDVDFGADVYAPNEGLSGTEDTLNAVAFGLSTGTFDCPPVPLGSCRAAGATRLVISDKPNDRQDALTFSWTKGEATSFAELGDPLGGSFYRVCVYDAGGLVRRAAAPAGDLCKVRNCWKRTGSTSNPNGFVYRDTKVAPSGTNSVMLRAGATNKARVQWRARGVELEDGPLAVVPPVVVEVSANDSPVCFGQTFAASDITRNTSKELRAKAK